MLTNRTVCMRLTINGSAPISSAIAPICVRPAGAADNKQVTRFQFVNFFSKKPKTNALTIMAELSNKIGKNIEKN